MPRRGERRLRIKSLGLSLRLRTFLIPEKNHWLRRIILIFYFILFDYFSTLVFCHTPWEEANIYARFFMENLGIHAGLTLFVLSANFSVYILLTLDSNVVRLPSRIAVVAESFVDFVFAWFIAGLHFDGGASWFWTAPSLLRQGPGAALYLFGVFVFIRPPRLFCGRRFSAYQCATY
ncbi:MAG: hypothetical protein QXM37_03025 [Candidatus Bathyarchaeia archaeon]